MAQAYYIAQFILCICLDQSIYPLITTTGKLRDDSYYQITTPNEDIKKNMIDLPKAEKSKGSLLFEDFSDSIFIIFFDHKKEN